MNEVNAMEYYSFCKKEEILPFCPTWMNMEDIVLREISQIHKVSQYDLTYTWNLKMLST
jgi:hypothetical protein